MSEWYTSDYWGSRYNKETDTQERYVHARFSVNLDNVAEYFAKPMNYDGEPGYELTITFNRAERPGTYGREASLAIMTWLKENKGIDLFLPLPEIKQ